MNHVNINKDSECCGCRACENICPKKAISMLENKEGFLYPNVDESKCINCGLCKKVCPWLNDINREDYLQNPKCYAAKSKDINNQKDSSSGGIFGVLAKEILKNGGVVVGSEMTSQHKVHHVIIEKQEGLLRIQGSKYVYSDLENVFVEIKRILNDKKIVLFSGVPCQISGLLNFLQKKYDNLITVEVICHGTPSQKLFNKYIKYLEEKYNGNLIDYHFRSKKAANWGTFKALVSFKKNDTIFTKKINADFDPYYWSFLNSKNYRESCYQCKFANPKRNADITLGDFWGIEKIKPRMIDYNGVSVVIVNTNKGLNIFEKVKEKIEYDEVDYIDVQENNGQLKSPSQRLQDREDWYKDFEKDDFIKKIKIQKNLKSYVKVFFPQKLKFKLKKILSK